MILATRVLQATDIRFNTLENRNQLRSEITTSLKILTAPPSPKIKIKSVLVLSEVRGSARLELTVEDLTGDTGIDQKVQLP